MIARIISLAYLLFAYALEQFAYWKYVGGGNPRKKNHPNEQVVSPYGWSYLWDAVHFILLIATAYRLLFTDCALLRVVSPCSGVGYVLFLIGVWLRVWALRELGAFYDSGLTIKEGHQIITSGPYRLLRHPMHMGTNIEIAGLAFFAPLWLSVPGVLAVVALAVFKGRHEDEALLRELEGDYQTYYRRSWDVVDLFFRKL